MGEDREQTNGIIIHSSKSDVRTPVTLQDLHQRHANTGRFSRRGLSGYHYFIDFEGKVHKGRDLQEIGAHTLGHNADTIGICLEGGRSRGVLMNTYTETQLQQLFLLLHELRRRYGQLYIIGHNALSPDKPACPCFYWAAWLEDRGLL